MSWRLALKNMLRHRMRSIISICGIAFGVTALVFTQGFFESMYRALEENAIHAHTGHLQIMKKGFMREGRRTPFEFLILNEEELISQLEAVDGVTMVTPRLKTGGLFSTGERSVPVVLEGVDSLLPESWVIAE